MNKNKNAIHQEAVLNGKVTTLNGYIRKPKILKINELARYSENYIKARQNSSKEVGEFNNDESRNEKAR